MFDRKVTKIVLAILLGYFVGMGVLYFLDDRPKGGLRDVHEMLDSDAPAGPDQEAMELAQGFSRKADKIAEEDSDKALRLLEDALRVFDDKWARDTILSRKLDIMLSKGEVREAIRLGAETAAGLQEEKLSLEEAEKKIRESLASSGSHDTYFNRLNRAIGQGLYEKARKMIEDASEERTTINEKHIDMFYVARALGSLGKNEAAKVLYKDVASNPDTHFQEAASSRVVTYLSFKGDPKRLMDYDPGPYDLAMAFAAKADKIAYEDGYTDRALQLLDETMPLFEGEERKLLLNHKLAILANEGKWRKVISLIAEGARRKPPEKREEALADIEAVKELMEKIEREEILTDVKTGADLMKILEDEDILTDIESTRELIERLQELEE